MDPIEKLLAKLAPKQRAVVERILDAISRGEDHALDIKRLKGYQNIFRVRKGNIRIIYRREDTYKL